MSVPLFSPELQAALKASTGPLTCVGNPIDITFETNIFIYKDLLELVCKSGKSMALSSTVYLGPGTL